MALMQCYDEHLQYVDHGGAHADEKQNVGKEWFLWYRRSICTEISRSVLT